MKSGVLETYKELLPINDSTPMISLGEGNTPLVKSNNLVKLIGCKELYFKLESCNPSGSFKDRGMVVAIAKALESKSVGVICASTGNTSASAAAYSAHCGLDAYVLVPKGEVAVGKLVQAVAYGAKIIIVNGNFDEALTLVREFVEEYPITLVNSVNPYRIEGQKTAAFEVSDEIGEAPDYLFIPVGNAGNITAYWKGFSEYKSLGITSKSPKMMGFQASGAAPIVLGKKVDNPETIASAIRIGNPASWDKALVARDESGGIIDKVTDDQILEAYRLLASEEGIFGEPASAASLAGLIKLSRLGQKFTNDTIVCVITGNGLKDPDLAKTSMPNNSIEIQPEMTLLSKAIFNSTKD
ncbi:MAG TPA: threonine synthase [Dehalococcoidia bacterium]|jgi:threonine synthase|nr:threonine synthase [Dehalococcoidia bacterium]|tara:strand:+ start:3394 stop:4458 length:1065 start_codon:yes stop_codon:yes gene_type:complete